MKQGLDVLKLESCGLLNAILLQMSVNFSMTTLSLDSEINYFLLRYIMPVLSVYLNTTHLSLTLASAMKAFARTTSKVETPNILFGS